MKLQKVGGVAPGANAVLSASFLANLVVNPRPGIGPNDHMDAAKVIPAWAASPLTHLSAETEFILFGIAFLPIIRALRERMQADASNMTRIALSVYFCPTCAGTTHRVGC
jgi:hypothetical protein